MLVSINWLREFVPYEGDVDVLADKLTMLGLEVDEIIHPFEHLEQLVVGHVLECGPHPEADKLSVTKVDVGTEVLDIVCGAPNVAQGQKVAVAKIGAVLPGDFAIKKAKIRGVASFGMICSEKELELSEDHHGIMVLNDSLVPGTNLVDALNLDRVVLDIDLTPNRADCLSVLGVAREVATAFGLPLTLPKVKLTEVGEDASSQVSIVIDDPELCPLYQARLIDGIKVAPSPAWMRYRLLAVGLRSISNVVDVTNYVLMELGQPLHAFDRDLLAGDTVRVGLARKGTKFITLDNQERELLDSDLLIWDSEKPVALAGVMGGGNSEVSDGSTRLLLESAVFRPASVRKTARRLALPSDASHRFERGVDQVGNTLAMNRAAQLICELSGGKLLAGTPKAEPKPWEQPKLHFRPARATRIVGITFDPSFCAKTLTSLGCHIEEEDSSDWMVYPPSYRLDLEREVDLVEEVVRVYGIDRVPETLPVVPREMGRESGSTEFDFASRIKLWGRGVGLNECINYSFVGDRDLDFLGLSQAGRVHIANPLSEEQNVLRTDVGAGLIQSLRFNLTRGNTDLHLFEVAKTFHADPDSETCTREEERLCLLLHGNRYGSGYPWPQEECDFSDMKGLLLHLFRSFHLPEATFEHEKDHSWLCPCVRVTLGGSVVGLVGMLRADLAEAVKARADVWYADLSLPKLRAVKEQCSICFQDLPKFPPVRRDVTFVAPLDLPVGTVIENVLSQSVKLLESIQLIDQFHPEHEEAKNLTYRLTYRSADKTLKDKEVDKAHTKIVQTVIDRLAVTLQ